MSKRFEQALLQSFSSTLENLAFMEISAFRKTAAPAIPADIRGIRLPIYAPVEATLDLRMPLRLLTEIGEAVYAIPREELDAQMLGDLLAEILNTAAGLLMTELLPSQQAFHLGLPEKPPRSSSPSPTPVQWTFDMEGESFFLAVTGAELLNI